MFSSSPLSAPPPLVVDWGTYSVRVGIAGDALPRCLLPAVVGLPHPQLCCSSSGAASGNGSNGSSSRRSKWRGGHSSSCRLLGNGAAGGGGAGGYGSAAAFMCPLNPLQKRDHVDVYPVVVYEHPSFGLAAAAAAGASRVKRQQGDACRSTTECLADAAATAEADGGDGEEEDDCGSGRPGGARERRDHAAFSAAAGSSCALPGGYHVEMNGFESLIEAACGADALDEGSLEGRAVLLSEPNAMDRPLRDAYAELMFETFKTSQLFLGKKAALACFGCARTSSLVVDVGHSHASACGVQEGYVLQKSIREIPFAAQQLSILSRLALGRSGVPLTPGYAVTRVPLAAADATCSEAEGAEEVWGGGSSSGGGSGEAVLLPACKKSHHGGKAANSLYLSAGGGRNLAGAAASAAATGRGGGGVKGEATTRVGGEKLGAATAVGAGTGIYCSIDRRYREAVEVGACPHVTSSYQAWGRFHLAEVLAQVLGECHPTAAAARKQQQEQLVCRQQQWAAPAARGGGAASQQQRGSGGGGRRRGGGGAGGQQQLWRAAAAGRGKGEEESSASEQHAEEKQPTTTVGRRAGTRRRSSGTSAGAAAGGERKRGTGSSAAVRGQGDSSGGAGGGGPTGGADEEEPPYVLPDGTAVGTETVKLVREGVAEALFNVPLRLRVFGEVWAGSSSRTAAAAAGSSSTGAAGFPDAFLDGWRCSSAAGAASSAPVNGGRSSAAATAAATAAAAGVGGSSTGSAPLWSAYEAAATGATYPRFLSRVAVSDLIKSTLSSCGRGAARRDVTATIIPTGGGSLYPGFLARFKAEVCLKEAPNFP